MTTESRVEPAPGANSADVDAVVAGTAYMQTLFIGLLSATLLRSGPVRHAQITSRNRSARRDLQAG